MPKTKFTHPEEITSFICVSSLLVGYQCIYNEKIMQWYRYADPYQAGMFAVDL